LGDGKISKSGTTEEWGENRGKRGVRCGERVYLKYRRKNESSIIRLGKSRTNRETGSEASGTIKLKTQRATISRFILWSGGKS